MPASEFKAALAAVLVHEGGFSNHPKDPGGATMKGVTQRVYDVYRDREGLPRQSVRNISQNEIGDIYRRQYWDEIKGDELPAGVAYFVFDFAVNSGPRRAAQFLQRALRMNAVDGQIGMATIAAAKAHPNHDQLIADMAAARQRFVESLGTFSTFGKGWTRRIAEAKRRAQSLASGAIGPDPIIVADATDDAAAKALDRDRKPRPTTGVADAAIAAGTGTGGVGITLSQTREQLEPLAGGSSWIGTIVAVLVIASAVLVLGGGLYRWWQSRRAAEYDQDLAA